MTVEPVGDSENLTFSSEFLCGLIGFSLLSLWVCSFLFFRAGPLLMLPGLVREMCSGFYLLGCGVCFLLMRALYDRINSRKALGRLLVAGLLLVLAYELLWFSPLSIIFASALSALLGQLWLQFLSRFNRGFLALGVAVTFSGIFIALVDFLEPLASFVFSQVLPVVSLALLIVLFKRTSDGWVSVSKAESDAEYVISKHSIATVIFDGVFMGLAANLFMADPFIAAPIIAGFALVIVAMGIIALVMNRNGAMLEDAMLNSYVVRAAPFVLVLPFTEGLATNLCAGGLIIMMAMNIYMTMMAQMEQVRFCHISSICVFGSGMFTLCLGGFFGWSIGCSLRGIDADLYQRAAVIFILFMALLVANSYVFKRQYPGTDEIIIKTQTDMVEPAGVDRFLLAVQELSKRYGLSPRQSEVFELLARGRNSEYISKKFYVSRSTTKAHINAIYKRMDIHSQQELINLVDESMAKMERGQS